MQDYTAQLVTDSVIETGFLSCEQSSVEPNSTSMMLHFNLASFSEDGAACVARLR